MTDGNGTISRRSFIAGFGLAAAGIAGAGLVGCAPQESAAPTAAAASTAASGSDTPSWLGSAPKIEDIADTVDCDVLVIGAGTGGLFAACSAAEEGASVVVLEKNAVGSAVKSDIGAANSRYQKEDGCVIDKHQMLWDMYRYANGECDTRLHSLWFDNSGATVDWYGDRLAERGVVMWHEAASENPAKVSLCRHYPTGHSPAWPIGEDGKATLDGNTVLADYATGLGVDFRWKTPMVELLMDGEKVAGAIAQGESGYLQVNAGKGVIVCTGGYGLNDDMLAALQPQTLDYISAKDCNPGVEGDGIKACLWAGASMDHTHSAMLFDRGGLKPDQTADPAAGAQMFWLGSHPWLKVNLEGERFANEGSGVYDYILHCAAHEPDHTYCTIYDSNWTTYAEQMDMHGCARLFDYENGAPSNVNVKKITGMNQKLLDDGYLQQADTIEELAQKLGLPADKLVATVKRYNDLYDAGTDEDFGKETYRLSKIDTPPYYGIRQSGRILCTMDGINIDTNLQALREDGTPIEGLYVVGNDSGNYYSMTYPNISTGNACGRTITFGRLAGKIVAGK